MRVSHYLVLGMGLVLSLGCVADRSHFLGKRDRIATVPRLFAQSRVGAGYDRVDRDHVSGNTCGCYACASSRATDPKQVPTVALKETRLKAIAPPDMKSKPALSQIFAGFKKKSAEPTQAARLPATEIPVVRQVKANELPIAWVEENQTPSSKLPSSSDSAALRPQFIDAGSKLEAVDLRATMQPMVATLQPRRETLEPTLAIRQPELEMPESEIEMPEPELEIPEPEFVELADTVSSRFVNPTMIEFESFEPVNVPVSVAEKVVEVSPPVAAQPPIETFEPVRTPVPVAVPQPVKVAVEDYRFEPAPADPIEVPVEINRPVVFRVKYDRRAQLALAKKETLVSKVVPVEEKPIILRAVGPLKSAVSTPRSADSRAESGVYRIAKRSTGYYGFIPDGNGSMQFQNLPELHPAVNDFDSTYIQPLPTFSAPSGPPIPFRPIPRLKKAIPEAATSGLEEREKERDSNEVIDFKSSENRPVRSVESRKVQCIGRSNEANQFSQRPYSDSQTNNVVDVHRNANGEGFGLSWDRSNDEVSFDREEDPHQRPGRYYSNRDRSSASEALDPFGDAGSPVMPIQGVQSPPETNREPAKQRLMDTITTVPIPKPLWRGPALSGNPVLAPQPIPPMPNPASGLWEDKTTRILRLRAVQPGDSNQPSIARFNLQAPLIIRGVKAHKRAMEMMAEQTDSGGALRSEAGMKTIER